ncbi:hypothetical protein B0J12DRAFT_791049 [Macrophomina phaseolina]|uniref:Altered inheritance of mitochondria protein 6 n=1 Tax=Macrophomina phaseolina TaxID=35725 RepID=A0ABQ8FPR3_9PEZI|nr:hypothetical protein B0J12DRAFT_791049 [Macrophomina phaseolina]
MSLLHPVSIYMRRLGSRESRSSDELLSGGENCGIETPPRRRRWITKSVFSLLAITTFGILLWLVIAYMKIKNLLQVSPPSNAYSAISSLWKNPDDASPLILYQLTHGGFADVSPLPCHSHNDYWRKVPLFDAISYGCASVEADIWLVDSPDDNRQISFDGRPPQKIKNIELQVGHALDALDIDRTLDSLYLGPLFRLLYERTWPDDGSNPGIFESSPSTTLVLLIDFKPSKNIQAVWESLQIHLITFRMYGWLTRWDRERNARVAGPLTIVATGDAPFDEIVASTHGDVFYDAPLEKLATNDRYNTSNTYYASGSLSGLVGKVGLGRSLSGAQIEKLRGIVSGAQEKGLVSRVWGTPKWPVTTRNKVWEQLLEAGVGVLNVDEFGTATKKDWGLCKVAGIELCT